MPVYWIDKSFQVYAHELLQHFPTLSTDRRVKLLWDFLKIFLLQPTFRISSGGSGISSGGAGISSGGAGFSSGGAGITSGGAGIASSGAGFTSGGAGITSGGAGITSGGTSAPVQLAEIRHTAIAKHFID